MKYVWTLLISMVPLVELRGAIPIGDGMGVPWYVAVIIAMIGNMIPVPIIFFFARRVLEWGANKPVIGKFFTWCLEKGRKGGEKLKEKAGRGMFWALMLFVGIPFQEERAGRGLRLRTGRRHHHAGDAAGICRLVRHHGLSVYPRQKIEKTADHRDRRSFLQRNVRR